jgi:type II secretory pathway pseudopilin PulG
LVMKKQLAAVLVNSKGFSLLEVVIACLVAVLFFLLVLQFTSVGMFSKARVQETTEVLSWIQKDLETVRSSANTYQLASLVGNVGVGSTVLTSGATEDFRNGDIVRFDGVQPDATPYTINGNPVGSQLSITPGLTVPHSQGDRLAIQSSLATTLVYPVTAGNTSVTVYSAAEVMPGNAVTLGNPEDPSSTPKSSSNHGQTQKQARTANGQEVYTIASTASNTVTFDRALEDTEVANAPIRLYRCKAESRDAGLADGLRDKLAGSNQTGTSTTVVLDGTQTKAKSGKQFTVERVMSVVDIAPFNLLQVSYEVDPPLGSPSPIDAFVTRIIPEVAFFCE